MAWEETRARGGPLTKTTTFPTVGATLVVALVSGVRVLPTSRAPTRGAPTCRKHHDAVA